MIKKYNGYKWIKVPRYKMDESLSWEDRYQQLEAHHIAETTFLINEIRNLAQQLENFMDSPYNQGTNAFKAGKTLDDNPYESGTVEYDSWNFGWDAGQEDSLREK